jgi:hypothetical protein
MSSQSQDSNNVSLKLSEITGNKHKPTGLEPEIMKSISQQRDGGRQSLTNVEYEHASKELIQRSFIEKFPRTFKYSSDPIYRNQTYALHSFIPSKGATPDNDGIFGMFKIRGSCGTLEEADEQAEEIIRNVDSYNTVFHSYCGKWFPATSSSKYTEEVNEIDINKKIKDRVSENLKEKRKKDKTELQEIEEREEELRTDVKDSIDQDEDPLKNYIELYVKKAHCLHTLDRYKLDIEKLDKVMTDAQKLIEDMDVEHPTFKDEYLDVYKKARTKVGLTNNADMDVIVKYMQI